MNENTGKSTLIQISKELNVSEDVALWRVLRENKTRFAAAKKLQVSPQSITNWINEHGIYCDWHLPDKKQKTAE